jgi:hypothetical protein
MGDSEPADGANKGACSGSVDDGAIGKPVGGRAMGLDGGSESGGVVSGTGAGNSNDKGAQGVGSSEQLKSGEGAKKPRQSSDRRVGEARGRKGEIDAVDGRQGEVVWRRNRSVVWKRSRQASVLMHGMAGVGGGVQARSELGAEGSCAGDEGGDLGRQQHGSGKGEGCGSGDHDDGQNAGQGIQMWQRDGN